MRIGLQDDLQLIEAVELRREAVLDGFDAEGDGEVSLADPRWPLDQ
jgi:hypothetical protein